MKVFKRIYYHGETVKPVLSIMIPALHQRKRMWNDLLAEIQYQLIGMDKEGKYRQSVEVVMTLNDGEDATAGPKRNFLMDKAEGMYGWFIDDDDMIAPGALAAVLEALETKPDVIGLVGTITATNGQSRRFEHFLEHKEYRTNGEVYERFPNHISPMKLELMRQIRFEDKYPEDTPWAYWMRDAGLLKTQVKIEQPIYIYRSRMTNF